MSQCTQPLRPLIPLTDSFPDSFGRRALTSLIFDTLVTLQRLAERAAISGGIVAGSRKSALAVPPEAKRNIPGWVTAQRGNRCSVLAICKSIVDRHGLPERA